MYKGKIPFYDYSNHPGKDRMAKYTGNLVDYVSKFEDDSGWVEWCDNYVFESELEVTAYGRGRSSATFILQDEQGHEYNCFMSSIIDVIRHKDFAAGRLKAKWTFEKRGKNYGIVLAE